MRARRQDRVPMLLDALGAGEDHPAVRAVLDALGRDPVTVEERLVGEPAHLARRLAFSSGGEVVLHDGAVTAVVLHTRPTLFAPQGIALHEWVPRAGHGRLDEIAQSVGERPRFGGRHAYFVRDGGYVRCRFEGAWTEPGHLAELAVTLARPGLERQPDDDFCPGCGDLLVRGSDGPDVAATVAQLGRVRDAGRLVEERSVVPLADLRRLHASGLMERVESQLRCTSCDRIACLTLHREAPPTFVHASYDEARRRPLEAVPPVEQWGDAARVRAAADALRCIDLRPGSWFLLEHTSGLYLQSRSSRSHMVEGSCLVRLDPSEVEGYRTGGREFLDRLARRIDGDRPWCDDTHYGRRNLTLDPQAEGWVQAVDAALVNHTWVAQGRQAAHRRLMAEGT